MQLRHVAYFVGTVDAGSVSGAARALHVTQPALSRQLRQLESDLGVALFERSAGRLALSRTGAALLPRARDLLAAADDLRDAAAFHRTGGVQRLTIAAPTVTLTDVVSPFVATLTPEDPVVDVRSADGLSPGQSLREGADLVIAARRAEPPFRSLLLAVLPVWAYVRPDHPWAGRTSVQLAELVGQPLLCPPATFAAREALEAAVGSADVAAPEVVETANGTIAQALAATGRGVAVVSDDPRFGLHPLAVEVGRGALELALVAAWDGRGVAGPSTEAFARRLRAWVAERYPAP